MTDREFLYQPLEALEKLVSFTKECGLPIPSVTYEGEEAIKALNFFLKQPEKQWQGLVEQEIKEVNKVADEYDKGYRDGILWSAHILKARNK